MRNVSEHLTGVQRAALVLFAMGKERAAEVLKHMEISDIERLCASMAASKPVPFALLENILAQFISAVEKQTVFDGDAEEYVRSMLSSALGSGQAGFVIDRVICGGSNPNIFRLRELDTLALADWMQSEHPQIAANLLALIDRQRAAEVVLELPAELRPFILARVASLEELSSEAISELESAISKKCIVRSKPSTVKGIAVAANILNKIENSVSMQLLDDISAIDDELARRIEDKMFVFEEITKLDDRDMQTLLREISTDRLLTALQGVSDDLKNKIFGNMSKRTAEMLREDLEASMPASTKEVEAAQKEILMIVKALAGSGGVAADM